MTFLWLQNLKQNNAITTQSLYRINKCHTKTLCTPQYECSDMPTSKTGFSSNIEAILAGCLSCTGLTRNKTQVVLARVWRHNYWESVVSETQTRYHNKKPVRLLFTLYSDEMGVIYRAITGWMHSDKPQIIDKRKNTNTRKTTDKTINNTVKINTQTCSACNKYKALTVTDNCTTYDWMIYLGP